MTAVQTRFQCDVLPLVKEMALRFIVAVDKNQTTVADNGKPSLQCFCQSGRQGYYAGLALLGLEFEVWLALPRSFSTVGKAKTSDSVARSSSPLGQPL